MITITLKQIQACRPCTSGWNKLLAAKSEQPFDQPFLMSDLLVTNDLADTTWAMRCLPEHSNLWRKFAVWCARQMQHLMTDPRSIAALDVAWRHSDGLATDAELEAAWDAAWPATWDASCAAGAPEDKQQAAKLRQILDAGQWVDDEVML